MTRVELRAQLLLAAAQLDRALQLQYARLDRDRHQPWGVRCDPWEAVDPNGRPLLLDGLAALGQVYAALAQLEARP